MTLINAFEPTMAAALEAIAQEVAAQRRVPNATYRLQFNRAFTFRDATALVPYLAALGISDCYASPILKARPGSMHGYDLTDPSQLNPDLGSPEDFEEFCAALRAHGMGLVLDTVPNHMGINDSSNLWWMDVLENGPSSIYASYFDIQWQPVKEELRDKVLLPILEDQYGKVLEAGKLRLHYEDGSFYFLHYSTRLPVAPRSYRLVLTCAAERMTEALGADHPQAQELQSILTALNYLPPATERDPERIAERYREKEVIKRRVAALYTAAPDAQAAIDGAVATFNGDVDDPRSFDLLDGLLAVQCYRLAFWRVAAEEIN
ncbi:MAG: alpha-amylase family glycosyl hydrolase, partial [Chloroflexi bacterium]|nr:alpha-amylase family glycosyl hydrolase [Chloroflexota bacterium]